VSTVEIDVHPDAATLAVGIARRLERVLRLSQEGGTSPRVLLTGGTIANAAYRELDKDALDWSRVEFWFGDERYIPANLPDRNDRQARDAFLARVGATHVHTVADNDCSLSAAEAAALYAASLPAEPFDVALFGVGPDGHAASLFPGFPQLSEGDTPVAAVFDSPKPPPVRITLTYPALNNSRSVWFLVSGPDKADAVSRALAADGTIEETPARGIAGRTETVWMLDADAAAQLRPDA
jgi:6-phosphogluconolactonase